MDNMGVKAIDDQHLVVTLEAPSTFFLSLTAFSTYYPLNEKAHKEWGEAYATEPDKMLYCGPFVIDEWKHGSKLSLEEELQLLGCCQRETHRRQLRHDQRH